MVTIPLGRSDYYRRVSDQARLRLKNRFFEANPLTSAQTALISRPGVKKFMSVGNGPIRALYAEPGAFQDSLFVISGTYLYKVSTSGTSTLCGQLSVVPLGNPKMVATGFIGTVPEYLFIAEGGVLWCYADSGFAIANLTLSLNVVNNDTVTIDGVVYKFTSGSVDTGSPAGTVGDPWLVKLGAVSSESLQNLSDAINDFGIAGTAYSTALTPHPTVQAYQNTTTDLYVRAVTNGAAGNSIAVSETSGNAAWSGATLAGGGSPSLIQVPVPDDAGAVSIDYINGYVIVIPVQNEGVNGRFYWVKPGETTIDPLDYATAERSPDAINQVVVFGDKFWLAGNKTTEPWYTTGNPDEPMNRFSGILFDRGCWEGTAIQVKESLILVDPDGAVFQIGGNLKRISTPDIEERIRRAIQLQAAEA